MGNVKLSTITGTFYAEDRNELLNQIVAMADNKKPNHFSRMVIAPHAGYYFSGKLAYSAINHLERSISTVFVIAPAHKMAIEKTTCPTYTHFQTPIGLLEINTPLIEEIKNEFGIELNDEPFEEEHAIEVQLPLIQNVFQKVKIVPILTSIHDSATIYKILQKYYDKKTYGFVISSDLSHFMPDEKARKIDNLTSQMIESKNISQFRQGQACNAVGICAAIKFAKERNFDFLRIGLMNSSDVTQDKNSVVGYGAWFLSEITKNEFLKQHFSKAIKNVCLNSIKTKGQADFKNYPAILDEYGASFVTLEIQGALRGCIGSILPYRPLIEDLIDNANKSAYFDPRFEPLNESEVYEIDIKVSLLDAPVKIDFSDEEDLLSKIEENKDGIIIEDNGHHAVYLPSVWEQIKDKKAFLNSLKQKAGLSANYFSDTFQAFKFNTVYLDK